MPAVLVDTNLPVYAHDPGEPTKKAGAVHVLDGLHSAGQGRLSVPSLARALRPGRSLAEIAAGAGFSDQAT